MKDNAVHQSCRRPESYPSSVMRFRLASNFVLGKAFWLTRTNFCGGTKQAHARSNIGLCVSWSSHCINNILKPTIVVLRASHCYSLLLAPLEIKVTPGTWVRAPLISADRFGLLIQIPAFVHWPSRFTESCLFDILLRNWKWLQLKTRNVRIRLWSTNKGLYSYFNTSQYWRLAAQWSSGMTQPSQDVRWARFLYTV